MVLRRCPTTGSASSIRDRTPREQRDAIYTKVYNNATRLASKDRTDSLVEELVANGADPKAARAQARLELQLPGHADQVRMAKEG